MVEKFHATIRVTSHIEAPTQNPSEDTEFYKTVNTLPEPVQDFISSLSSSFLEEDVHDRFKKDNGLITKLYSRFERSGVPENDISVIMKHFDLPTLYRDFSNNPAVPVDKSES